MLLIRELHKPDLAFLPIGDLFTMDARGRFGLRLLQVPKVIPMHSARPPLTGAEQLAELVKSQVECEVWALEPGRREVVAPGRGACHCRRRTGLLEADQAARSLVLGPKAENAAVEEEMSAHSSGYFHWRATTTGDEIVITQACGARRSISTTRSLAVERNAGAAEAPLPVYSPRYIAHMLSDQRSPACSAISPACFKSEQCHAGSRTVTVEWELESRATSLHMLGYTTPRGPMRIAARDVRFGWAHITVGWHHCQNRGVVGGAQHTLLSAAAKGPASKPASRSPSDPGTTDLTEATPTGRLDGGNVSLSSRTKRVPAVLLHRGR
jgi:hypothetical protein